MPVPVIAEAFKSFRIGQDTLARLVQGVDKAAMDKQSEGIEPLVKKKYALSPGQLFAACWQVRAPSANLVIAFCDYTYAVLTYEKLAHVLQ